MKQVDMSLRQLVQRMTEQFGPHALTFQDTKSSNSILFRSSVEPSISFSVVALESPTQAYSIQVEVEGPEHQHQLGAIVDTVLTIPTGILVDRTGNIEEVLGIIGMYRKGLPYQAL